MSGRTLILLSCSRDKRHGGDHFDGTARRLPSASTLPNLAMDVLKTRNQIYELLHGVRSRLYDEDQKGGFRDERVSNRVLRLGPDFGGDDIGVPIYLPAYKRYSGRFFAELERVAPLFWDEITVRPIDILFVSGLYGLLYWNELIQEYDCHLKDYREFDRKAISSLWKPVLSPALADLLKARAQAGHPIDCVYDLLSEEAYQHVFDWEIVSSQGASVHHRIFQGLAGPDILPFVARILADHLPLFLESKERFRNGTWRDLSMHDGRVVRMGFESRLKQDSLATREGDIDHVRKAVLKAHPELESLPRQVFEDLVLAEHSWLKVEGLPQFDFGAVIVSFTKVVERYFKAVLPGCPPKPQFGEIIAAIKHRPGWMALRGELYELSRLRGEGGAHPGNRNVNDLRRARLYTFKVLERGEKIRGIESPKQGPLE
jgi:hypothetical protein